MTEIETLLAALRTLRMPAMPEEYDIHAEIMRALTNAGIDYAHEYRLAPRCRIDFKIGNIGIEVKKGRPVTAKLREQLAKYLSSAELEAVVVVTQLNVNLPKTILNKPVYLLSLNRLWGVALP